MFKASHSSSDLKQLERQLKSQQLHAQNLQSQLYQIQSSKAYQIWQNTVFFKRGSLKIIQNPSKFLQVLSILFKQGPSGLVQKAVSDSDTDQFLQTINYQYQVWLKNHYPTPKDLADQRQKSQSFKHQPLISIITPTYNTPVQYLRECIESILSQSYPNWELCLADDCSTDPVVREIIKEYAEKDERIKYTFRKTNGNISLASNSALKLATGVWIGLLDHDDILWPNALFETVKLMNEIPQTDFIYSDEDKLSEDGLSHCEPFFKPGWSPDLLLSFNYITHFAVFKKSLVDKIGGFRIGYEGSQDYDLFLRATELAKKISNVQTILYSWRKIKNSTASDYSVKPQADIAAVLALEDSLKRRKIRAEVLPGICVGTFRIKYQIKGNPLVSIIIPTRNHLNLLKKCLDSVISKSTYSNYEIIIADTGSTDPEIDMYYKQLLAHYSNVKLIHWKKSFNYSAVNNFAVTQAHGEYLLFLNNDTEIITSDWIESMLEHAQKPQVGAVGAKLLYPDGRIQHAGIILGIRGGDIEHGVAGHYLKYFNDCALGNPMGNLKDVVRNVSAVTAACLMISKRTFNLLHGFDQSFIIAFNDVDFNLNLLKNNYVNIYTPFSILYHHESISVGSPENYSRDINQFQKETHQMLESWHHVLENDKYYNKNLSLNNESNSIDI